MTMTQRTKSYVANLSGCYDLTLPGSGSGGSDSKFYTPCKLLAGTYPQQDIWLDNKHDHTEIDHLISGTNYTGGSIPSSTHVLGVTVTDSLDMTLAFSGLGMTAIAFTVDTAGSGTVSYEIIVFTEGTGTTFTIPTSSNRLLDFGVSSDIGAITSVHIKSTTISGDSASIMALGLIKLVPIQSSILAAQTEAAIIAKSGMELVDDLIPAGFTGYNYPNPNSHALTHNTVILTLDNPANRIQSDGPYSYGGSTPPYITPVGGSQHLLYLFGISGDLLSITFTNPVTDVGFFVDPGTGFKLWRISIDIYVGYVLTNTWHIFDVNHIEQSQYKGIGNVYTTPPNGWSAPYFSPHIISGTNGITRVTVRSDIGNSADFPSYVLPNYHSLAAIRIVTGGSGGGGGGNPSGGNPCRDDPPFTDCLDGEARLDPKYSYDAVGGIMYRTIIVPGDSGSERRYNIWPEGRSSWTISYQDVGREEITYLINFFRARQGKVRSFRFKDWSDYRADHEILVNNGTIHIQLIKTYHDFLNPITRIIYKPFTEVSETKTYTGIRLYINDILQNPSTYTLDSATGIITMNAVHPGAVIKWSGEFDLPVRFNTDELRITLVDFDIRDCGTLEVIELKG